MPSSDPSIARRGVRSHSSRMSQTKRIEKALGLLKDRWLSPFDLILEVLDDKNVKYTGYQNKLYKVTFSQPRIVLEIYQQLWTFSRSSRSRLPHP